MLPMLEEGAEQASFTRLTKPSNSIHWNVVAALRPSVDRYFDKVMVNVPDQDVRKNRLSMLSTYAPQIFYHR